MPPGTSAGILSSASDVSLTYEAGTQPSCPSISTIFHQSPSFSTTDENESPFMKLSSSGRAAWLSKAAQYLAWRHVPP
jgi:hypothetical protein